MKARFFALAALVLGLASCQQDFNEPTMVGGEVDFQLAVAAPELTRAGFDLDEDDKYGYDSAHGAIDYLSEADWADKYDLRYSLEVYDKVDDYTNATPVKDRQVIIVDRYEAVTFDLRLVPNRDYHFVVFADFVPQGADATANIDIQSTLGLRHNIGENLGQITIKEDTINDEIADAYFATKDIKITNSAAQDIVLRRPFGKVRVIATDLAELNLNVDPGKVKVAYEAYHPAAFNAVTGEVSGEYTQESYEYVYGTNVGKASLADHLYTQYYDDKSKFGVKNANGVERHTHMTLFTDYILAEKEGQTAYHFTMTVYDKSGAPIKETHFSTDIPVERNMLTTVIGNVLTTATEINVTIDDNFASEYNVNYVGVASARELQEAINNAKAGENNIINFEADIDAVAEEYNPIIITEIPETTIVLNGNDYKFNGCMQIKGMSEYKNAHTVFKNIEFETADVSSFMGAAFIFCDDEPNTSFRYPDSVTIKGCSFTATGAAEKNAVGVKMWSLKNNLVVEDCTANGMHSMVQLSSSGDANVTINGATIENSKNGFGLGQVTTANIKNTVIDAVGYGIRLDGCTANTTIEASTINANIPVVVRKLTTGEYTLNFVASNTLTAGNEGANAKAYQVVFTNGDDEATFVEPTGTFVANGAENFKVFPEPVVDESNFVANDLEDLMKWAYKAANSTESPNLVLTANIELPKKAIVADHANKTYTFTGDDIVVVDGIPSGNNWPAISDYETSLNTETGVYEYYGGVIDGGGHTIKGLRINHDLVASGFLCWTKGAKVDNLIFDDAVVYNKGGQYGETYTGIIIGRCWDGSHVNNCHIKKSSVLGKNEVGGIVGRVYRRTVKTNTPDGQPQ
ncbi:MAG: hypothetical protein IIX19_01860, partial [Alistipes sp.]|nr:hypothetical protein [Alistipes sp.]